MISMALALPRVQETDLPNQVPTMDEAAFHHLYEHTVRSLRAYLVRSCGNLELADDLLQESYLRMLRSGFEGQSDEHRRRYLFRIATNLVRDHFRRLRPQTLEISDRDVQGGDAEAAHLRWDVGAAMAELGVRDRQMLWLAHVEGASHREVAEILGVRPASVRSMLFRARRRLAEALRSRGFGPADLEGRS
jgi:RNA polymerase sigma-70 factor (ECF subfamily)